MNVNAQLDLDRDLSRLLRCNWAVPTAEVYRDIEEIEGRWIAPLAATFESQAPTFANRRELVDALRELLAEQARNPPASYEIFAQHATRDQFKVMVAQLAIDGLTESQSLLPIVRRLPHRTAMAVFRVLIDEFGCGNVDRVHSGLYRELVTELGMSVDVLDYLPETATETYAFVNLFHWLASRAPTPDYFLGAFTYFESSVFNVFRPFAVAAERLGIQRSEYYTEHLYIDSYHSKQMEMALRELDRERGLDLAKVWTGVELASQLVGDAMDTAIERALGDTLR